MGSSNNFTSKHVLQFLSQFTAFEKIQMEYQVVFIFYM
jgi:hypothetical protein